MSVLISVCVCVVRVFVVCTKVLQKFVTLCELKKAIKPGRVFIKPWNHSNIPLKEFVLNPFTSAHCTKTSVNHG